MRVLGVDPGSRNTGYGCIEVEGSSIRQISNGTLKLTGYDKGDGSLAVPLERRLQLLFEGLCGVVDQCQPHAIVVEKIFFAKNAMSALKLGHARGVVLLCSALKGLRFFEYSATEVKRCVAGHGHADKDAVAKMVQRIVGPYRFHTADASDALALAIAHAMLHRERRSPSVGLT